MQWTCQLPRYYSLLFKENHLLYIEFSGNFTCDFAYIVFVPSDYVMGLMLLHAGISARRTEIAASGAVFQEYSLFQLLVFVWNITEQMWIPTERSN